MVRKLLSIFVALFMALSAMAIDINYTLDLHNGITLGELYKSIKCDNDTLGDEFSLGLYALDFNSFYSQSDSSIVCSDIYNGNRNLAIVYTLDGELFNFFNANCGEVNFTINGEKAEYFGRGLGFLIYVPYYIPPVSIDYTITGLKTTCAKMTAEEVLKDVKLPSAEELSLAGLEYDKIFLSDRIKDPQIDPLDSKTVIEPGKTYSLVLSFNKVGEMNRENVTAKVDGRPMSVVESGTQLFFISQFTEESEAEIEKFSVTGLNENCAGKTVGEVLNDVVVPSAADLESLGLELDHLLISDNESDPQANPLAVKNVLFDDTYYFVAFFKRTNSSKDMSGVRMSINGSDIEGAGNNAFHFFVYPFTVGTTSVSPSPAAEKSVVYAEGGKIDCTGEVTKIYDVNGLDVTASNGSLPAGVYIVACDGVRSKVIMQ